MSTDEDFDDDEFFDAAAFEEESVEEMLIDSSDEDEEELLQFMMSSAASARHTVELMMDTLEDSDDESEREWGTGSRPGKAKNKARDFKGAYERLFKNYFSTDPPPVYDETDFERRFRMPRAVFNRIKDAIFDKGLFREKVANFSGKKGIHPLVRLTACIRRLAYGDSADRDDENLDMAESTINMSLKQFNKLMIEEFGAQYLNRCPSAAEIERVTTINAGRGFPGMFASWDCKHFSWKNCPVSLAGQYKGKESDKTLVLEAIADADLYIWYYFFGEAGSLNDINILNKSTIVGSILNGTFDLKIQPYTINNTHRDWLYFLVDGIYPKYSIFINSFQHPHDEKEKYFAKCQEAVRKDIERAFGVLVQQFQILQRPIKNWYWTDIVDIMDVCIILHNMIVESRRENFSVSEYLESGSAEWYAATDVFRASETENNPPPVVSLFKNADEQIGDVLLEADLATRMAIRVGAVNENIRNTAEHFSLKSDLMEHLWHRRRNRRQRRNTNNHDDEE
jgi:hypothetical protein